MAGVHARGATTAIKKRKLQAARSYFIWQPKILYSASNYYLTSILSIQQVKTVIRATFVAIQTADRLEKRGVSISARLRPSDTYT